MKSFEREIKIACMYSMHSKLILTNTHAFTHTYTPQVIIEKKKREELDSRLSEERSALEELRRKLRYAEERAQKAEARTIQLEEDGMRSEEKLRSAERQLKILEVCCVGVCIHAIHCTWVDIDVVTQLLTKIQCVS